MALKLVATLALLGGVKLLFLVWAAGGSNALVVWLVLGALTASRLLAHLPEKDPRDFFFLTHWTLFGEALVIIPLTIMSSGTLIICIGTQALAALMFPYALKEKKP